MRLPDDVLKCVLFLCLKEQGNKEKIHLFGTAFFATVPSTTFPERYSHLYLITARHNIEDAEAEINSRPKKYHPKLFVRVNKGDEEAITVELPDSWTYPANDVIDVAVMPAGDLDNDALDTRHLTLSCVATEVKIRHHGVGIGSEVFVIGLFSLHEGTKRNSPIVRQGIISSMMNEQLMNAKKRKKYGAYLTEVLSTKGMSGSPVLVRSNRTYVAGEKPQCHVLLLGLMKGHFSAELEGYSKEKGEDFHAGLSIVVPVQEILKVIDGEKLTKEREKRDQELIKEYVDPVEG